jgi:hypothetical protein
MYWPQVMSMGNEQGQSIQGRSSRWTRRAGELLGCRQVGSVVRLLEPISN